MANKVTAHNKINNIRNSILESNKTLEKSFQVLLDNMICKKTLSSFTSEMSNAIKSCLKILERTLCSAQLAATAIAGSTAKVPEKTVSFNLSAHKKSHTIEIIVPSAKGALSQINTESKRMYNEYINQLNTCKSEIANLPVEEQTLDSISTIETVFKGIYSGIFGGTNKKEVVKNAKRAFVNNIAEAIRVVQELITIIDQYTNNNSKLMVLIDEFDSCENNVFNQFKLNYTKDSINKTSVYNDSSVPAENELKSSIDELVMKQNEIYAITHENCKELDDEVARLKKLYDSVYGTVTLTPNMEGHSMKQTDYALPNKGPNVGCCVTAYAIGLSIVNGHYYNPETLANRYGARRDGVGLETYRHNFDAQLVYEKLKQGKPTLFHYGHTLNNDAQHYVLITGVKKGADYTNLSINDFNVIDPADGCDKNLGELISKTTGFKIYGFECFK